MIPVVVLSSSSHDADVERSYALHANAYVVKPADFDGFAGVIKAIDTCFLGLITPPPAGHHRHPIADLGPDSQATG